MMEKNSRLRVAGSGFRVPGIRRSSTAWVLAFALWALFLSNSPAAPASEASPLDYSSFKIITERNIFNPRRSARYAPRSESRETTRSVKTDSLVLLGTMSYEKGPFAFFDGTGSDYSKVVKRDDTIAGFRIIDIQSGFVKLNSATNEIQLPVGMQLRREEGGEWQVAARPEPTVASSYRSGSSSGRNRSRRSSSSTSSTPESETTAAGATAADEEPAPPAEGTDEPILVPVPVPTNAEAGAASDVTNETDPVLRRLLERRRQQEEQ